MTISLQRRRHRLKLLLVTTFCVAIVAGFTLYRQHENPFTFLVEFGKSLPCMGFVVAYFILPLFGFPVSVFLIVAGMRFGFLGGMLVAASGILFHHVIAFRVVHGWLRSILISRLERAGYRVPFFIERNQICYTALFAAVHGPPYIAKVYLLALTNVTFRVYLCVGAP